MKTPDQPPWLPVCYELHVFLFISILSTFLTLKSFFITNCTMNFALWNKSFISDNKKKRLCKDFKNLIYFSHCNFLF